MIANHINSPVENRVVVGVTTPGCMKAAFVRCDMSAVILNLPNAEDPQGCTMRSRIYLTRRTTQPGRHCNAIKTMKQAYLHSVEVLLLFE